jgi:hypothetical protein
MARVKKIKSGGINGNGKVSLSNGEERAPSFDDLGAWEQRFLRNHAPDPTGMENGDRKELVESFRESFLEQFPRWETTLRNGNGIETLGQWMKTGARSRNRHREKIESRKPFAPTSF